MKGMLKFIAALSITLLLMLMFRALFFTVYAVPNDSMKPRFESGDRILLNRCSYGLRTGEDTRLGYSRWFKQQIDRGDITAFNYPLDSLGRVSKSPVLVGCCSAIPGDTVKINNDLSVVVPGKNVSIDITSDNVILICNMLRMHEHRDSYVCNGKLYIDNREVHRVTFSKDYYWIKGFGSSTFNDSRYFGFLPEDHIIGRIVMLVYSIDSKQSLDRCMRWDRFLKLL